MKYTISLLLLFSILKVQAQALIDTTKYFESANVGTVKNITSNEVCAIVFFVSGPQTNWDANSKKRMLRNDEKSFAKLKKELKKYDVDFKIHLEIFNLEHDFKVDSIVNYKKQPFAKDHLIKHSKYKAFNAKKIWAYYSNSEIPFFKQKTYLTYEGGYFLIFYHQGLGLSTASSTLLNSHHTSAIYEDEKSPEYITVFEYNTNWEKRTRNVTVHETLHLFGAWDLYKNPSNWDSYTGAGNLEDDYNNLLEKYPQSIMRSSEKITIDEFTAWRVGINKNPQSWFLEMVPIGYHKSYYEDEQ